jgi:WD40 repeat protein
MDGDGSDGIGEAEVTRAVAQGGIRAWILRSGRAILNMTPVVILTGITASALAPIVAPLLSSAMAGPHADPALEGLVQQLGNLGADYLSSILRGVVRRLRTPAGPSAGHPGIPGISEETLHGALKSYLEQELSGPRGAEARTAVTAFIQAVNGMNVTLQAASESGVPGLPRHIAEVVNELSRTASEFRALHDDLQDAVVSIQRDTTYLRAAARDTNDHVHRLTVELALVRRIMAREASGNAGAGGTRINRDGADGSGSDPGEGTAGDPFCPLEGVRPYPGLAPFEEWDAGWFYGRDDLIATMVSGLNDRLDGGTPLVVMGASGAGKSSVLRAGLVPELRNGGLSPAGSGDWPVMIITPGRYPLRDLGLRLGDLAGLTSSQALDEIEENPSRAALLTRQALIADDRRRGIVRPAASRRSVTTLAERRMVLVIDQFEEVFTECGDEVQRSRFIEAVCAITGGDQDDPPPALVVIGLNLAFVEQCTAHPSLAPALRNPFIVGPMSTAELREAIELPAMQAGLVVEPGLVDTMLADIGAVESRGTAGLLTYDPGKLPLLAHALLATWERREGNRLTVAAYRAAGGIKEAIAATADQLYESLDAPGRQVAKRLLRHMVRVHPEAEDSRRQVSRAMLLAELPVGDQETAGRLLDELGKRRLVTADAGKVQIAHEALLRHWPKLAAWLQEDRDWQQAEQRLAEQAHEWAAHGRNPGRLLRGTQLALLKEQLDSRRRAELGDTEKAFVREAERREARARRAWRSLLAGLAALAIVAGGLAAVAYHDAAVASQQRTLAQAGQLDAQAASLRSSDPGKSLLLSLEAYRVQPNPDSLSSLLSAQANFSPDPLANPAGPAHAVAYDPAAPLLAVAGHDDAVTLWDTQGRRWLSTRLRGGSPFYAVAFDSGGSLLAGAEQDGKVIVWNTRTFQQAAVLGTAGGPSVNAIAFSPNDQVIATAGLDDTVTLRSTRSHRVLDLYDTGHTVSALAFSRNGMFLAAAGSDHAIRVWNPALHHAGVRVLTGHSAPVRAIAFSPGSAVLASASDDGTVRLWDPSTGALLGAQTIGASGSVGVDALAFSPTGGLLASGGTDDVVRLWDVPTLAPAGVLTGPAGRVAGVAFSPDGRVIASADFDGTVSTWQVAEPSQSGDAPTVTVAAAVAAGQTVATIGDGSAVTLWKILKSGQPTAYATIRYTTKRQGKSPGTRATDIALNPDGSVLAVAELNGQVQLWSTRSTPLRLIRTLIGPGTLTALAYRPVPGSAQVAAGDSNGNIYLWSTSSAVPRRITGGLPGPVASLAFSPDGTLLGASSPDGTFMLAHADGSQWIRLAERASPLDPVKTSAFSSDGRMLATLLTDGSIQLWTVADDGQLIGPSQLTGQAGVATSVTFSAGGTLAAFYEDGTIHLWDVRHRAAPAALATISGLPNPTTVAWEPGTQVVIGAAPDGTLLTWDTDPATVAARICASPLAAEAHTLTPPPCPARLACQEIVRARPLYVTAAGMPRADTLARHGPPRPPRR